MLRAEGFRLLRDIFLYLEDASSSVISVKISKLPHSFCPEVYSFVLFFFLV